jgi:DNA-binding response OmpR family regulator
MNKLLIVDDSEDLLELMEYFLRRHGYIVRTLNKAYDIYEAISEFQPDLLILDLFLADQDGRDICKQIKKSAETKNLCILLFSASPTSLADYKKYDADDFIEKPFECKDLVQKIEKVLNYTRSSRGIPGGFISLEQPY